MKGLYWDSGREREDTFLERNKKARFRALEGTMKAQPKGKCKEGTV